MFGGQPIFFNRVAHNKIVSDAPKPLGGEQEPGHLPAHDVATDAGPPF